MIEPVCLPTHTYSRKLTHRHFQINVWIIVTISICCSMVQFTDVLLIVVHLLLFHIFWWANWSHDTGHIKYMIQICILQFVINPCQWEKTKPIEYQLIIYDGVHKPVFSPNGKKTTSMADNNWMKTNKSMVIKYFSQAAIWHHNLTRGLQLQDLESVRKSQKSNWFSRCISDTAATLAKSKCGRDVYFLDWTLAKKLA